MRQKNLFRFLIIPCLLASGFFVCSFSALAAEYYVDGTGWAGDGNPGTENQPFKTLKKAAETARAGDTVYVKNGTYFETLAPANSGAEQNPIIFKAYPGHAPKIDGRNALDYGICLDGRNYIRIEGFEIADIKLHAILANWTPETGYGLEIAGNKIHDSGIGDTNTAAVYYRFSRRGQITGNELYGNGGDGIAIPEVLDGILISGNHIHENAVDGIKGGGRGEIIIENNLIHDMRSDQTHGDGIQYMGNEATIRGNTVYNCTQNIYIDTYNPIPGSNPEGDYHIYNNLIYSTVPGDFWNGINIDNRYNSINAVYVYNNTIVDQSTGSGGFNYFTDFPIYNLVIKNNIFSNSIIHINSADNLVLDNNLYDRSQISWPGNKLYGGAAQLRAETGFEKSGIDGDPGFADRQNFNFQNNSGFGAPVSSSSSEQISAVISGTPAPRPVSQISNQAPPFRARLFLPGIRLA